MKRIVVALFLSVGCGGSSYAQMFFTPGYLVTRAGDTLRGDIREKDNSTVLFRVGNGADEQRYTPEQVAAYGTDNALNRSATWPESGTVRRVFMHEITTGHVSLLELIKPEERLSHAIRLPDQTYIPLRGSLALLLLTRHLTGCKNPQFQKLLSNRSFYNGRAYFERIVTAYNRCVGAGTDVRRKKVLHYEAGLLAGVARNTWFYAANQKRLSSYWHPNGVYSPTSAGVFGGFLTIVPRKRLSLTVEGLFSQYKGDRTVRVNDPLNPANPAERQYSFAEQYLAFPITGRYVFSDGSVRWYVKGGACLSYALNIDGQYSGGGIQNANVPIRAGIGVGYLVGVGADVAVSKKHRLLVELRTMPHLVLDNVTRMANSRSLQLTVSVPLIER